MGILVSCLIIIGVVMYVYSRLSPNQTQTSMNNATTTDGLVITTVAEGHGDGAVAGDVVSVNYTGKFQDGKTFDSNTDAAFGHVEPFQFPLGAGQVIPGWDKGVLGMKVGEKRHLVVPPALGYGANTYGPIPGNSTLEFDVELLAITHSK